MSSITRTAPIIMAAALAPALAAQDASAQEATGTEVANVDSSDRSSEAPHPAVAHALADLERAGKNIDKAKDLDKKSKTQTISRRAVVEQTRDLATASEATGTTATDDGQLGVTIHNDIVRGGGLGSRYEVTYTTERDAEGNETRVPSGFKERPAEDVRKREQAYGVGLVREMGALAKVAQANGGKLNDDQMREFLTLADRADGDTPSYGKDQLIAARMANLLGVAGEDGPVRVIKEGDRVVRLDVTHPPIEPPAVAMKTELPKTPLAKRLGDQHSRRPDAGNNDAGSTRGNRGQRVAGGQKSNRRPAGAGRR